MLFTAVTFIAFTALVAVIAWWRTRDDDLSTQDGYFLAGRSLTGPVIAGSLMLTNLSTELFDQHGTDRLGSHLSSSTCHSGAGISAALSQDGTDYRTGIPRKPLRQHNQAYRFHHVPARLLAHLPADRSVFGRTGVQPDLRS